MGVISLAADRRRPRARWAKCLRDGSNCQMCIRSRSNGPTEELLEEKAAELGATIHALEIMSDHVHMFVESDPTLAPAHIAAQFKGFTSRVLREEFPFLKTRLPSLWSRSYYIGSAGHVSEATVRKYIENQRTR